MLERTQYLSARVKAMKGRLLDYSDYQKMLKMSNSEISEFLEKSSYQDEINSLGVKYGGKKLIELALVKDQIRTSKKLVRISQGDTKDIIQTYFLKYDIRNLRKLLRWKNSDKETRMKEETIKDYLVESPRISKPELERLLGEDTGDEEFRNFISDKFPELEVDLENAEDEVELEILLDKGYYLALASKLREYNQLDHQVETFLASRIDVANLKTVLRLKNRAEKEEIREFLILPEKGSSLGRIGRNDLERMADETRTEFLESVKSTYLGDYLEKDLSDEAFENSLDRAGAEFSRNLGLSKPFSIGPVIGYISRKETEVSNLRSIVRAKELGISEEEIRERLVI